MRQPDSVIQKRWADKNVLNGKCLRCANLRLKTSKLYCEKHYFQTVSKSVFGIVGQWEVLRNLLIIQNYRCAATGDRIVIGLNDSIDHIIPKSRTSFYNEISNLRWVTRKFNTVKNNLTDSELLDLLEKMKLNLDRQREPRGCALILEPEGISASPNRINGISEN